MSSELTDLEVGNMISEIYNQGIPNYPSPSTDLHVLITEFLNCSGLARTLGLKKETLTPVSVQHARFQPGHNTLLCHSPDSESSALDTTKPYRTSSLISNPPCVLLHGTLGCPWATATGLAGPATSQTYPQTNSSEAKKGSTNIFIIKKTNVKAGHLH